MIKRAATWLFWLMMCVLALGCVPTISTLIVRWEAR